MLILDKLKMLKKGRSEFRSYCQKVEWKKNKIKRWDLVTHTHTHLEERK